MSDRPDLPAATLLAESTSLLGMFIGFAAFGAVVLLVGQTLHALLRYNPAGKKVQWVLVVFTTLSFILALIFVALDMTLGVNMFIYHRNHVGGPEGYAGTHYSDPRNIVANTFALACGWLADGLFLYRCIVVFRFKPVVIALPILMYISALIIGSLFLASASKAGSSLFAHLAVGFGVPYFALSAALNAVITTLIASRLLKARWELKKTNPAAALDNSYVSISTMIIESSMLYAATTICLVIPYGLGSPAAGLFLAVLPMSAVLSSNLLVYRLANRRAWNSNTCMLTLSSNSVGFRDSEAQDRSSSGHMGEKESIEN